MVGPRHPITIWVTIVFLLGLTTLPFWGEGAAIFIDAERTLLSQSASPNGKRIAQVERIVVGGVPSIVVIVRSRWVPNWYLTGCLAASHYQEADAILTWRSDNSLRVATRTDPQQWDKRGAPFHDNGCRDVATTILPAYAGSPISDISRP